MSRSIRPDPFGGGQAILLRGDVAGRAAPSRARTAARSASRSARQHHRRYAAAWLSPSDPGVSREAFWFEEAGIEPTQANLARAMGSRRPSVTEMVRRLVDEGLIGHRAKTLPLHRPWPGGRGPDRQPPPPDRGLPRRGVRHPVGRGARGGPHLRARDLTEPRAAHDELLKDAKACPHGHPIGDKRFASRARCSRVCRPGRGPRAQARERGPDLLRLLKRTGIEPGDTITIEPRRDELVLQTRGGRPGVALTSASRCRCRSPSAATGSRPTCPTGRRALLVSSHWGR